MSEADILALTYEDSCTVYRPFQEKKETGESIFKNGLEGKRVYENIPCSLSSFSGGKLQRGKPTSGVAVEYQLFVRPEIDIQANDTIVVTRLGKEVLLIAGVAEHFVSHSNIPVSRKEDKA